MKLTTKKLVTTALFVSLAFAISFIEIPMFLPFLKLDLSLVFSALGGFLLGPIEGVVIIILKEFLCFLTKSTTAGIGEIANGIMGISFIIIPSIVYHYKKGIKIVILTLIVGIFVECITSLVCNYFITFPLYLDKNEIDSMFAQYWYILLLFNFIKTIIVSVITILLYKRISYLFKKI